MLLNGTEILIFSLLYERNKIFDIESSYQYLLLTNYLIKYSENRIFE